MPDLTTAPPQPLTIYVAIGNSDNRLTQEQWSRFHARVDGEITGIAERYDGTLYGRWVSASTDPHQNACWAFAEPTSDIWRGEGGVREYLRDVLRDAAVAYGQDSIAWTEGRPEFIAGRQA